MEPWRQWAWWRPGGFREPVLAWLTGGRWGLGRWTAEEVDRIRAKATERLARFRDLIE